ncbi:MAG: L-2-amino-thiazoline-4-carboxylic acid hydrolase [Acidobacteriota bacterium]
MGNAPGTGVNLLEKRRIEAEILAEVYAVLTERLGRVAALDAVEDTILRAAYEAGKAFAASAPQGPSLTHFVTLTEIWRCGGALTIENVRHAPDSVSFDVTRCRYAESYREMGLPEELATRLSCLRDGAFCSGYSPCLTLTRPETIASGAKCCPFTFTWIEA